MKISRQCRPGWPPVFSARARALAPAPGAPSGLWAFTVTLLPHVGLVVVAAVTILTALGWFP